MFPSFPLLPPNDPGFVDPQGAVDKDPDDTDDEHAGQNFIGPLDISCGHDHVEVQGKGIGKLYVNPKSRASNWEARPDLVEAAREDIANNPTPGTEGFDWGGLKQTMDNTDFAGRKIDTSSTTDLD